DPFPWLVVGSALASVLIVAIAGTVSFFMGLYSGWFTGVYILPPAPASATLTLGGGDYEPPELDDAPPAVAAPVPRTQAQVKPKVDLQVSGWHTLPRTANGVLKYAPDEGTLVIAQVKLVNLTDEELDLGFPWSLVDATGREWDAPLGCHMALKDSVNPFDDLPAGATIEGPLCVEGPADPAGSRLRFEPSFDGSVTEFPL
ncbi:MAG: hypothetical protein KC656_12930, partial [Myxococcales bacterium]|nr:hypothetical protein [Myxococcales bacterium]